VTHLHVMSDSDPGKVLLRTQSPERIRTELAAVGVRFERWETTYPLSADAKADAKADADADAVMDAYRHEIDRICEAEGYTLVDVARMRPDPEDPTWPERARKARSTFLEEHFHDEDEVRFFVDGSGCFYLHVHDRVHAVVCTAGDLISVPARTVHWFDMGASPDFTAIRFFKKEDGWVGSFLPQSIAGLFPTLDELKVTAVEVP
jgi:1,2-dihydroxy-3-keto-5-methylthiopentene dioxygenase